MWKKLFEQRDAVSHYIERQSQEVKDAQGIVYVDAEAIPEVSPSPIYYSLQFIQLPNVS